MSSTQDIHPQSAPLSDRPPHPAAGSPGAEGPLKRAVGIVTEAGVRWSDDACARMGASLAYYALFSIFPLLLVAVTALGFFLGHDPATREKLLASVSTILSPEFESLLGDTLTSMQSHETARGVGAVIGVITLLFGASGVFGELDTSLNTIWRVKGGPSTGFKTTVLRLIKDKAISFAAVVGAGLVLLTTLLVSTGLTALSATAGQAVPAIVLWKSIEIVVSLGLSTAVFALVFRMLPRTYVTWRDVLGGAFFTAVMFSLLKHLLAWYLGHLGSYAAYGAVGAVLGLLTWIYLASLLVFLGAELTRVYAEREGSVSRRATKAASVT